ncbi:uncharacterized protein VP01_1865g5 [Puccinia sorghi]|uniref:Bud22 domain-containing protein n=1 Tax=Puccinia sorghi TaxID=27349 RepID=A0A0L6VDX4_9BASI|nr:uncharacterized protein VP01_1865g5 [Puccinia sorghi]
MDTHQERPAKRTKTENENSDPDHQLILALRNLSRAAKKSKAFEIQHLVRKIRSVKDGKPIRGKESTAVDVQSLEADLNQFKSIHVENLSKKILYTRLKRQSPELITRSIFSDLYESKEPVQLTRIENKISSQKSLSELLRQTVSKLLVDLQLHHPVDKPHSKAEPTSVSSEKLATKEILPSTRQPLPRSGSSELSGSEDEVELLGEDLDEAVARELADLDGGTGREGSSEAEGSTPATSDVDDDGSQSDSSDEHPDSQQPPDLARKTKLSKPTSNKPGTRPSSSTFLPALNVGYTLGDSDASSDLDIDDLAVDKMERERGRKNRRGQQARRAIWEKKYGKSAKHLMKLKQNQGSKQQKPAEGIRPRVTGNSQRATSHGKHANEGKTTGSNSEPVAAAPKRAGDPQLHPSWIAKQNQLKNLAALKPAGKKILFD